MSPIILDQPAPTAGFILKLGPQDLSGFARMNPDDKLDPYGVSFVEPSFAETPFADTQVLISTTVQNREQHWVLFLADPSRLKDQLHALIQAINIALAQRPLVIEWRDAGASASTYYDVVFGRFEPDFNFRRSVHGYAAGTLHTWVAGYGHTGTTRVAATAAGTGIFLQVPIPSVGGDAPALMDVRINAGAVVPSLGRIVAFAPLPDPSYVARIPAASLTDAQPGATLINDTTADGGQYLGLPVTLAGGASGVACKVPLPNPTIAGGDNRILAVVVGAIAGGVGITALDPYGNVMGPTAVASNSQSWGLVDLGVCRLPTVGFPTLPKISILAGALWASGAPTPISYATPNAFNVNEVLCLPDKNLTLLLENRPGGSYLSKDGFARTGALAGQNDDIGNPWSPGFNNVTGGSALLVEQAGIAYLAAAGPIVGLASPPFPSAFHTEHLAGILTDSMLIQAQPNMTGGDVRLLKDTAAGKYVQARVNGDANYLDLSAATSTTLNRLASVAVASLLGRSLRLSLQCQGGQAFVNLTRSDGGGLLVAGASSAYASIGASSAALAGAGVPALTLGQGAGSGAFGPQVAAWEVDTLTSGNLAAYDAYHIHGVSADSYRTSSAGDFAGQKLVSVQRGAFPKMQPSTSAVAVVLAPFDQGRASDAISAVIAVRERFCYGR